MAKKKVETITETIDDGFMVDDGPIIDDGVTDDSFMVEPEPYTAEELAAMQAEMERQGEIATAHQILNQTDYNMLKAIEELLSATSAADLVSKIKALSDDFGEIIKLRRKQREIINKLEQ